MLAWVAAQDRRSDWKRLRVALVGVLAAQARQDGTSAPTWAWLCEETGSSRRTVARALVELAAAGWLTVVETGSTELTRPVWDTSTGNRAAVYGLLTPEGMGVPVHRRRPVETGREPVSTSRTTGTPLRSSFGTLPSSRARHPQAASGGGSWSSHQQARTSRERLELAVTLRRRSPVLRGASDRALRHTLRPWLEDGWTIADLLWALDHDPDGRAHGYTQAVRCVPGWLRHRLKPWQGKPAPSAAHAAARARQEAEQQRQREAWAQAAAEAIPAGQSAAYAAARAALARQPRRKAAA